MLDNCDDLSFRRMMGTRIACLTMRLIARPGGGAIQNLCQDFGVCANCGGGGGGGGARPAHPKWLEPIHNDELLK